MAGITVLGKAHGDLGLIADEHRGDIFVLVAFSSTSGPPVAVVLGSLTFSVATILRSYPSLFGCQYATCIISKLLQIVREPLRYGVSGYRRNIRDALVG